MDQIAIKITDVKKMYRLGQIGGGTLQADLQSWWARARGKEDPNVKIGQTERLVGQTFMALNGITLTIHQGDRIGIIGSNGAGKSTLLKLISKVTAPTAGQIEIYGRVASMLEVGTGFNPEMTGRENVYMNGAILGMTKAEIDAKMEQIIDFSEVREFIDTPVKRYSSGMYVKLAFSVAAHLDSEIMIMDEVLAVGDVAFQNKCLNKMKSVALDEGKTVLYVSHNMNTIRALCSRCVVLDAGKVVFDGDVEDAIEVYSKSKAVNVRSEYDLGHYERGLSYRQTACHIRAIHVKSPTLKMGEKLEFSVDFQANAKMIVNLRCILTTATGEVIGLIPCSSFQLHEETDTFDFCWDTSGLAPNTYHMDFHLYEDKGYEMYKVDEIAQVFTFCVDETVYYYNMKWPRSYWGNIRLNEMAVK